MAKDPKNPQLGDVVFDGEEFTSYLADLLPRDLQGMRTAQAGFDEVIAEILSNHAEWGAKAGVTAEDIAQIGTGSERIARIDAFLPPLVKFVEVLRETRYLLEDQRQWVALNVAQSVDRRSLREPVLLAKYEKTRAYRSAAAKKGLKTRKKNAEAEAEQAEEAEQPKQAKQAKQAEQPKQAERPKQAEQAEQVEQA